MLVTIRLGARIAWQVPAREIENRAALSWRQASLVDCGIGEVGIGLGENDRIAAQH